MRWDFLRSRGTLAGGILTKGTIQRKEVRRC
jgi:hypothetical protein